MEIDGAVARRDAARRVPLAAFGLQSLLDCPVSAG